MQITQILVLVSCLVLIESRDEDFQDKLDVDMEIGVGRREFNILLEKVDYQSKLIEKQGQTIEALQNHIALSSSATKRSKHKKDISSEHKSRYTALACLGNKVTLSCPEEEQTITITEAYFGSYAYSCTKACCPPTPYTDCTKAVSHANENDWIVLNYKCNNETTCEWEYKGAVIDECETLAVGEIADYMQIYYDCSPDNTDEPVGFTAHAKGSKVYSTYEILHFDDVQSNFGGHYNMQTSSFHCPHHGIYLFSVGFNAQRDKSILVDIMRDNFVLSTSEAYVNTQLDVGSYSHSSGLVIVECDVAQVVWLRCILSPGSFYTTSKKSQFAGYLLHRYD